MKNRSISKLERSIFKILQILIDLNLPSIFCSRHLLVMLLKQLQYRTDRIWSIMSHIIIKYELCFSHSFFKQKFWLYRFEIIFFFLRLFFRYVLSDRVIGLFFKEFFVNLIKIIDVGFFRSPWWFDIITALKILICVIKNLRDFLWFNFLWIIVR